MIRYGVQYLFEKLLQKCRVLPISLQSSPYNHKKIPTTWVGILDLVAFNQLGMLFFMLAFLDFFNQFGVKGG